MLLAEEWKQDDCLVIDQAEGQSAQACMIFSQGSFVIKEMVSVFLFFEFFSSDTSEDVSPCLKEGHPHPMVSSKGKIYSADSVDRLGGT